MTVINYSIDHCSCSVDILRSQIIAFVLLTPKKCFCLTQPPRNPQLCQQNFRRKSLYQKRCAFKINPMKRREIYLRESRSVIHSLMNFHSNHGVKFTSSNSTTNNNDDEDGDDHGRITKTYLTCCLRK